jgi:hypothetical protein
MPQRAHYDTYPAQIKRVIMDTAFRGADCSHLSSILERFQAEDKREFDEYVMDTGNQETLAALAIVFAEDDKCSCLDVIRKFDGGRLFERLKDVKVPLVTGGEADHSLEELARKLGKAHCFPKKGGKKTKHRRFFKRRTQRKRVTSRRGRRRTGRRKHK